MTHPGGPEIATSLPTLRRKWDARLRESNAGSWLAALLFVAVPLVAANILTRLLMPEAGLRDLRNLVKTLALVAGYWAYVRRWERRPLREWSSSGAIPELLAGLMLGGLLFSSVVAVLAALGVYSLQSVGPLGDLGNAATSMLPKLVAGALVEELLFRLLLLRLLERALGAAWALAGSSLVFGLAHLGNPGATPAIGVILGTELGLLFGTAYLLTRRVWLCTALHLAWNFVQGAVFSLPVSGLTADGWLHGVLTGPSWLTGGAFGPEASMVSVVLCFAMSGCLALLATRRHRTTAPTARAPSEQVERDEPRTPP